MPSQSIELFASNLPIRISRSSTSQNEFVTHCGFTRLKSKNSWLRRSANEYSTAPKLGKEFRNASLDPLGHSPHSNCDFHVDGLGSASVWKTADSRYRAILRSQREKGDHVLSRCVHCSKASVTEILVMNFRRNAWLKVSQSVTNPRLATDGYTIGDAAQRCIRHSSTIPYKL